MDGWREPDKRYKQYSSTVVVDNHQVVVRGRIHDAAGMRQLFSSVEVFDVNTGCWEQRTTSGSPPLGDMDYSCVAVRNELHYFGGLGGGCLHNSVHTLSSSTLQWRMLAPSTTEGGAPMKKRCCGTVHFTDGKEDLLYVVGGYGDPIPSSPPRGAEYEREGGSMRTNEQHIFSLSTSELYCLS